MAPMHVRLEDLSASARKLSYRVLNVASRRTII